MSATAQALTEQSGIQSFTENRVRTGNLRSYAPGQSGNPAGKPLGSRNRITEAFLHDVYQSWQANGVEALQELRRDYVETYCKVVASLIPKQSAHIRATVNTSRPLDSINAELIQAVQALGYTVMPAQDSTDSSVVATDPSAHEIPTGGLVQMDSDCDSEGEALKDIHPCPSDTDTPCT